MVVDCGVYDARYTRSRVFSRRATRTFCEVRLNSRKGAESSETLETKPRYTSNESEKANREPSVGGRCRRHLERLEKAQRHGDDSSASPSASTSTSPSASTLASMDFVSELRAVETVSGQDDQESKRWSAVPSES